MEKKQNKGKNGIFRRIFNPATGEDDDSQASSKRSLIAELLFTALAFLVLNVLTYNLVRNIVADNLSRNAENVFSLTQVQVENDLNNSKMYLAGFSRTIRTSLMRGVGRDILEEYFMDLSSHLLTDSRQLAGFEGLAGYFENMPGGPAFIQTIEWEVTEGYYPSRRPWYQNAIAAHGEIAETISYHDWVNNNNILIYSLSIHDDDDKLLGVICMRLNIKDIGDRVVNVAINRGGWGMLISPDLVVLAHPNEPFVGIDAKDPSFPPSVYVPQMARGENVSEGSIKDYLGNVSITFFRRLSNGWYLGLVTPERPYYQSLRTLAYILGTLGVIFAAVLMIILIRIDMAKNKADKESRHKSAFLANMSHEIRTPMNAIIGMTTIGKAAADANRKNYCFLKIEAASNHLLGVINDILDMSKIEANKFELSPVEFNFEKMLQQVVNVINFRVDEKHQKLLVHIDRVIPTTIIGDDRRIAQVVSNLLSNAVKFTPEKGSIKLDTRFMGEAEGICTIQISVTDTGIGINHEQQKKLFQSFHQAESSTTRKYGGTGLGLAISKSIVELMGGKIWVHSEEGKGSTFAFTFQIKRGERKKQSLLAQDVHWGNLRIMVVDDDKDILMYFNEMTQGFGLSCDTAISGAEALHLVDQNGHYHIYFVDWKMPEIDGMQLASELKARTSENSVVIMISAAEWTTIESEAKKAGIDKFLSKPLFPSDIADAINEALGFDKRDRNREELNITGIFAGRRVLLVEDLDVNREVVQTLFEPSQLEIDCAENGVEAVRMFSEAPEKYELIFMDVNMPEMDGYDATRKIRALNTPRAQTVPIIAMTANVFREDIEKCLRVGMNSHIGKPLVFSEVVDKLREYLC
jgi:signal transduction histidine kinase/CheY-like chemotaxis protein